MAKQISLTKRELDIMSVLWRRSHATVADIRDDLTDSLAYPTVQTMLRVLENKGFVRHTMDGRAFVFHPLIGRDALADSVLKRLISKVYEGSRELLITRLVSDEKIPASELRRIKKVLQRRLNEAEE